MKICTRCNAERSLSEFHADKGNKDGLHYWCKPCAREIHSKKYVLKRPPQETNDLGECRCVRCGSFYKKTNRRQCNACLRKQQVARDGLERMRERARAGYARDPSKAIARAHSKDRRGVTLREVAINATSDGTLTQDRVVHLFASAKSCPYCGKQMSGKGKSLDHVVPIACGGKHSAFNVIVCCRSCNSAKGTLEMSEWIERVGARFGRLAAQRASIVVAPFLDSGAVQ
jgi:5-methylcytosine-specific restriction endonuclease McrA